jgi:hypothetical protein
MADVPQNPGWRAMASRGFADLSPPEAEHAILELPTNRAEYVGVLEDIGDYPERSPIGQRIPTDEEVAELKRQAGRWRAVALLEDERALRNTALLFNRVFVLDPFYDSGALLYAAWHDPLIKDEHARRLAEHAGLLSRASPLLRAGTAVLAPDHLPGSWNPRSSWRKPRPNADRRQLAGWSVRSALVLLYWADRLDALICATQHDVIAALDVALGVRAATSTVALAEPPRIDEAQSIRDLSLSELTELWADLRTVSRRRNHYCLEDVPFVLGGLAEGASERTPAAWRLTLGESSVPDPAMLLRRVLNGQDPERPPPLPRKRLRRRPLCLVPAS